MTAADAETDRMLQRLIETNAEAAVALDDYPHWRRMAEQQREYWTVRREEFLREMRREEARA